MQQIIDILATPAASTLILAAVAFAVTVLVKTSFVKRYQLERCILALEAGVQETYEIYVKTLKAAKEDGKLTDEERQEAREKAYALAKQMLASEGIDLAKFYGPRIAKAVIDKLVKRSKTAAAMAKGVLDVGSDGGAID